MKHVWVGGILTIFIAVCVGCGGGSSSAKDDAALRKQFEQRKPDLSHMSPQQRAYVQGLIAKYSNVKPSAPGQKPPGK